MPKIDDIVLDDGERRRVVDVRVVEHEDGSTTVLVTTEPAGVEE